MIEYKQSREEISKGISERKKYFSKANDGVNVMLQNKKENIKKKTDKLKFKLSQVSY